MADLGVPGTELRETVHGLAEFLLDYREYLAIRDGERIRWVVCRPGLSPGVQMAEVSPSAVMQDLECNGVPLPPELAPTKPVAAIEPTSCRHDEQRHERSEAFNTAKAEDHPALQPDRETLPRPALSIDGNEVTVDGKVYPLDDSQAAFVLALAEGGPGVWVAGRAMGIAVQPHPERIYAKLPQPIREKIESKPGAGYRIRPQKRG
jgi:hypothetical protein